MSDHSRNHGQDEARIRAMLDEQVTAMRERDAERLIARYAPDAVTFTLAPPLRNAPAAVHDVDALRSWFAGFEGPIDYEIRGAEVTAGDDVAFCHSLNRLTATQASSGQTFTLWFRSTLCLRRDGGAWRIAHEHTSTPFYMDGRFGAAIDLEP
jgi:uncharacterized protein (TIGR02246 family)